MRGLVACECSGVVRDAFNRLGHDFWSCDLKPSESWQPVVCAADLPECECCGEPYCPIHETHYADCGCIGPTQDDVSYSEDGLSASKHFQRDVFDVLAENDDFEILIAHPPCTYLSSSGLHWTTRGLRDPKLTADAIKFAERLWTASVPRICIENPVGCLSTKSVLGRRYQKIQPYQFGDDASKGTCLWIKGLPPLRPTKRIAPRIVNGKARWSNQTDSGQNKLGPSENRAAIRAETYPGIAAAMANQWGKES